MQLNTTVRLLQCYAFLHGVGLSHTDAEDVTGKSLGDI